MLIIEKGTQTFLKNFDLDKVIMLPNLTLSSKSSNQPNFQLSKTKQKYKKSYVWPIQIDRENKIPSGTALQILTNQIGCIVVWGLIPWSGSFCLLAFQLILTVSHNLCELLYEFLKYPRTEWL